MHRMKYKYKNKIMQAYASLIVIININFGKSTIQDNVTQQYKN